MLLCIGALRIIIFLRSERVLLKINSLSCSSHLSYGAAALRLREMSFNTHTHTHTYTYIYISFSMNVFHNNTKSNSYHFNFRFSPTLIHFYLFPNKCFIFHELDFIKLCNNFSRVNFATELSPYLVYKSIFVRLLLNIHLLFFFTVKLSIFSRLCVKHKSVISRSTHLCIKILHWFIKKLPRYRNNINIGRYTEFLVSDRYRFWISGIEPALVLSSVKITNVHSYMVTKI